MVDKEFHVASYVVRADTQHVAAVARRINAIEGLEVHATDQGKMIVTAEAGNVRRLAEIADDLEAMELVLNVAPVYHEYSADGNDGI